eukprot:1351197-Amphidinium_carterae.1
MLIVGLFGTYVALRVLGVVKSFGPFEERWQDKNLKTGMGPNDEFFERFSATSLAANEVDSDIESADFHMGSVDGGFSVWCHFVNCLLNLAAPYIVEMPLKRILFLVILVMLFLSSG